MTHTGGCLCGNVRYHVRGALKPPVACHCSQCARTSGHHAAMACTVSRDLDITGGQTLTWFRSSDGVRRGFCTNCGSNLFWESDPGDEIYITMGTLDRPTGLRLAAHIFVASKADYYDITDSLPQKDEW